MGTSIYILKPKKYQNLLIFLHNKNINYFELNHQTFFIPIIYHIITKKNVNSDNKIRSDGFKSLGESISKLTQLTSLNLNL